MKTIQEKEAQHFLKTKVDNIKNYEHKIIRNNKKINYLNQYFKTDFDFFYAITNNNDYFDLCGAYNESYTYKAFEIEAFFPFFHQESGLNWDIYINQKRKQK